MRVKLKRSQLTWFRRKATRSVNEIYAALLGTVDGGTVVVDYLRYPLAQVSTPDYFTLNMESMSDIEVQAAKDGLILVGSIHSHPGCMPVQSDTDHTLFTMGEKVVGICGVLDCKTYITFWEKSSSLPCTIEYY